MFFCSDPFLCSHNSNHFIYKAPNFLTAHGADYNKNREKMQKTVIRKNKALIKRKANRQFEKCERYYW